MPTKLQVIHARDFVRATPEGQLDLETSKTALANIVSISAALTDYHVLLDTRKSNVVMSVTDLWYLAEALSTLGGAFNTKTAVLCPTERFDSAEFFALCAQNRGLRVQAFRSFEDAIEWFIADWADA